MDFSDMKTELAARGFDYLSDTRLGRIINDAMHELDEMYVWPYRESSGSGETPVTVSDLGTIELVTNETDQYVIEPRTYQWLSETFGDLSLTGDPKYYYVAWPEGVPVVATYPTNTDTVGVQYWKIRADLSDSIDEPLAPARFHSVYLKIAQRMAESERGNVNIVQALQGEIDLMVARMVNALCGGQQLQGPGDVTRVWTAEDY